MTHRGVRLRIAYRGAALFDGDSDHLHFAAKYSGPGWHELLRTVDGLTIEALPIELPDEYPDPVEDDDDE